MKDSELLICLLLSLILIHCGGNPHDSSPSNDFDFNLPDLEGKTHGLKDYRGEVVVLNFWATWCPPCLEETPKLNDLHSRYKDSGVHVIGIALDKDSLEIVGPFVKKYDISYAILRGDREIFATLSAGSSGKDFQGVPTTLIIDRKGKIRERFDGSFESEQLEESLRSLLAE
ncbi:MAG: TlpA family protein disulfide reductase [Candidatus Zixiibacteriota bacterium]|nr:MAG: TlpA family protein disulfide reductase [candidate division Zixibacteria bacterium]